MDELSKNIKNGQIVIFGGSFNPPLNSHFSLAQEIINHHEEVQKVIFVPVNGQYKKDALISGEHRFNMLKLICDKNNKFEVSRMEIDSSRPLHTFETMNKFQELYPNYNIAFALGSDNLKELETWVYAKELIENFKIYVFKRNQDNIEKIIEESEFLKKYINSIIKVEENIVSNISSTYVRKILKENKSIDYLTQKEVIDYISENKLYH